MADTCRDTVVLLEKPHPGDAPEKIRYRKTLTKKNTPGTLQDAERSPAQARLSANTGPASCGKVTNRPQQMHSSENESELLQPEGRPSSLCLLPRGTA